MERKKKWIQPIFALHFPVPFDSNEESASMARLSSTPRSSPGTFVILRTFMRKSYCLFFSVEDSMIPTISVPSNCHGFLRGVMSPPAPMFAGGDEEALCVKFSPTHSDGSRNFQVMDVPIGT